MSTYPTLSLEAARRAFEGYKADRSIESLVKESTVQVRGPAFDEAQSVSLSNVLMELAYEIDRPGYPFERQAASLVHRHLGLHPIIAGDAGFWRWLTFSADGELAELVDWRYPKRETGHAREQYFGFGLLKDGMYAYLWFCAQSVLEPDLEDPYELSRRGDVDVWQSHVVRIDFGSVPQLARAFIRFVFPNEGTQYLSREQYRQLAKEVTRRNASMAFELLDDSESLELIRDIWESLDLQSVAE